MEQKYLGIFPYYEDSNYEFAGRSEETWALYDRVIRNEYTVYYAASGEGKSSLIRAGLIPILRRRDFFPIYIVFKDEEFNNISSIENFITNRIENVIGETLNVTYEQSAWSKSCFDQETSKQLKSNIWWKLRNYCFKRGDAELKTFFIFDQFEEVFSKANYDWTDKFFNWLEEVSTDYLPESLREIVNSRDIDVPTQKNFKALFSFRTEYLGDLDYWCVQKHFIPSLQDNRMCLKPLTPKGAKEIINLNESSLGKYADKIIQGCAEAKANTNNEDQPCVYALILSVVCQTLSEIPDNERIPLLDNLNNQQDDTIDDILLRFYKKKLLAAGLDYNKNEKIIADLENALVDEKGKRSRRDTDEASMQPLAKWIEELSAESNRLLKIIAKKVVNGHEVNTVEFPHDRLCKAIDSSKKERQKKIIWTLNRRMEWILFGVISTTIGIIAFLWNVLMPSIKPVVSNLISKNDQPEIINKFIHNYICKGDSSEYKGSSLDEGFSSIFLMVSLILFIPLLTMCYFQNGKKWKLSSTIISLFSLLSFILLISRNQAISFASSYVSIFTFMGLLFSSISLCVSILKLRETYTKGDSEGTINKYSQSNYSIWPLWGGFFIFASYVFYEFLFRTTFGVSEPQDSFWALFVLPLFYTFWAFGFFNMTFEKRTKKRMLFVYIVSFIFLLLLSLISLIPFHKEYKQSYGFIVSVILISLWIIASIYIVWHSKSNSNYYLFSKPKRLFVAVLGAIITIITFILNLGYNPIVITPKSIIHVASWRDIVVFEGDSDKRKFGVLYSTDGDTIIPCYVRISQKQINDLKNGKYPFSDGMFRIDSTLNNSPFSSDSITSNFDNSLEWNRYNKKVIASIPFGSTLEQYLHHIFQRGLPKNCSFKDSINYYSVCLFREIRKANINYGIHGKSIKLNSLRSLNTLDSLQHIALDNELKKIYLLDSLDKDSVSFESKEIIIRSGISDSIPRFKVLEDKHLIDFHRELSRSFLLCQIKDRARQSDMPSMFTLARQYLMTYFSHVHAMHMSIRSKIELDLSLLETNHDKKENFDFDIYSDDIINRRFFAWYDLFNVQCYMDMSYNVNNFKSVYSNVGVLYEHLDVIKRIANNLHSMRSETKTIFNDIDKNKNNTADSLSILLEYLMKQIKCKDDISQDIQSLQKKLEKSKQSAKTLADDQSLRMLKDSVFETLLPIMRKREMGIYNNAFENICKNLILVSIFRCNDFENDITNFSKYYSDKNNFYNKIIKQISNNNSKLNESRRQRNELNDAVKELYDLLK